MGGCLLYTHIYPKLSFFLNLLIKNRSSGIFNVSSDIKISKYEFGKRLIDKIIKNKKIYPNKFDEKNLQKDQTIWL